MMNNPGQDQGQDQGKISPPETNNNDQVSVREHGDRFFSRQLVVRVALAIVAGTFLLAILALGLVLGTRSTVRTLQSPPLCCPSEGRHLVAIVNDRFRPCDNLYAYVCTDVAKNGSGRSQTHLKNLREMIAGLATAPTERFASTPAPLNSSRAGMFLQGLYSSCMASTAAKPHRDQEGRDVPVHFAQMAEALWDVGKELLAALSEPNLLAFLLMTNLRYQIQSVVDVEYISSDETLIFYHEALQLGDEVHLVCPECVAAALMAYNRHGGRSRQVTDGASQEEANSSRLTFDDLGSFAERLHSLYPEKRVVKRFVMANVSELWPAEQFAKALTILSWVNSLADVGIESFAPHQLVILRREITDRKNWAVGAVYLVAHTAGRALLAFPPVLGAKFAHEACITLTTAMKALVSAVHWDLYGSPEKDQVVADVYRSVLDAVVLDATSALLVDGAGEETYHQLRTLLDNITLLTAETTNVDVAQVPQATPAEFARNMLLGRAFQFEARKKRQGLGLPDSMSEVDPVIHTGRRFRLEVPASFYRFVRVAKSSSLINSAVLGVRLAKILWSVVLRHDWDKALLDNVEQTVHCFAEVVRRESGALPGQLSGNYQETIKLAAASLALRTVVQTMSQEDWYLARHVDSDGTHPRRLSHAQFFFMLQAYFRCHVENGRFYEDCVNVPAAYAPEFERAFQCERTLLMHRFRASTHCRRGSV
ncbi:hypothetical protein V5799_006868 [Amblyomma americanum]|uniref:Uncharacterized protein n=1 Tax=Amblyomma americanum TaxID=6943 RepID=A0AAQ4DV70_AMBAM